MVLAAGRGRRFGGDKRRACLSDGTPLLVATLALAQRHFASVAVVLRADDELLALQIPTGVQVIRCAEADLGMGHSLAAGVTALSAEPAAAIAVLLGDMPWLADSTLQRLLAAADSQRLVFPVHEGERGHPVLFGRRYWPALTGLSGDHGARAVLAAHADAWLAIAMDDLGVVRDVDTPQALL